MDFHQLSRTTIGEKTLGQHLDKLLDVIGNAEDATNMMKIVSPLEVKTKAMDQMAKDMQKKIDILDSGVEGTEMI